MKFDSTVFAKLVFGTAVLVSTVGHANEDWLLGSWTAIADEDGTPADIIEFLPNGIHINYGYECRARNEMTYHIHDGDIYVTGEIPNKGPIAIVFRPTSDREQLTFTSPRTRNNATYARLANNPCHK